MFIDGFIIGVGAVGFGLFVIIVLVVNNKVDIEAVFCKVEWVIFVGLIILVLIMFIYLLLAVLNLIFKLIFFSLLIIIDFL